MYIPPKLIKQIEERTDIIELMRSYGVVIKYFAVYNTLALCPFHEDTIPSLAINTLKKVYHCFSCGASGNIFTFIMKKENITYFPFAVKKLAERVGIDIEKEQTTIRTQRRGK